MGSNPKHGHAPVCMRNKGGGYGGMEGEVLKSKMRNGNKDKSPLEIKQLKLQVGLNSRNQSGGTYLDRHCDFSQRSHQ